MRIDPAFFRYAQIEDDRDDRKQNGDSNQDDNKDQYQGESQGKNSRNHEKYQMTGDVLPYTYHLFDDTSRGLNNIYNVLGEIAAARMLPETDELKEKKLLLDTIISSKPIYNKHRNEIQQNFYHVGTAKTDSRVFFDNARAIIYKKDITEVQVKSEEYHITNPIERFSLFILADFAARLLYENDYESRIRGDKFYAILKKEAMQDLFFHPVIAGKVMEISTYSWENEEEKKLRNAAVANGKEYPALTEQNNKRMQRILSNTLAKVLRAGDEDDYKYRMETAQSKQIVQNARLLAHITDALSVAHKDADKQTLENFIAELNRNLKKEDQIDSEIYEKLFSN